MGHARGLEVDFRIVGAEDVNNPAVIANSLIKFRKKGLIRVKGDRTDPTVIVNFLEKFREKGRIRVICVGPDGSERVVYPPPLCETM